MANSFVTTSAWTLAALSPVIAAEQILTSGKLETVSVVDTTSRWSPVLGRTRPRVETHTAILAQWVNHRAATHEAAGSIPRWPFCFDLGRVKDSSPSHVLFTGTCIAYTPPPPGGRVF